jgi:uncharacterized membrane-anchored protein
MKKKIGLIVLLIICQLLVLIGMAGVRYYTKEKGKEIVLLTEPANFSDIVYDRNVYLSYIISGISWEK